MKKVLLITVFGLFMPFVLFVVLFGALIFIEPTLVINESNIKKVLEETKILKSWSWSKLELNHRWLSWHRRSLSADIKDFCFEFDSAALNASGCMKKISWDLELDFLNFRQPKISTIRPVEVNGDYLKVLMKQNSRSDQDQAVAPVDIWKYWSILWGEMIPDIKMEINKIEILKGNTSKNIDLVLNKIGDELKARIAEYSLYANPKLLEMYLPKTIALPKKSPTFPTLHLFDTKIVFKLSPKLITLLLDGRLESIHFRANSKLVLPLRESFTSLAFRKELLLNMKGQAEVDNIQDQMKDFVPEAFEDLPAPLNSMYGRVGMDLTTKQGVKEHEVLFLITSKVDLKNHQQVLAMEVSGNFELDLQSLAPKEFTFAVDFKEVLLKLPKLSKKELPPQFIPDPRIQNTGVKLIEKKKNKSPKIPMTVKLEALNDKSLIIKSNLLDEPVRLNLDLLLENGALTGFIKSLPLKTTIFKRPIKVPELMIEFQKYERKVLRGTIIFPLPEYKITMQLEGPLKSPRYSFTSKPPLSRNDIYSVLLFGRPMAELNPDDKRSAAQANEILAQGIFSLSVLYFLAGSPVEYIGLDPDSKEAQAQVGLGKRSSLRIGAGRDGVSSTGIRYAIGKGWYIDTSATAPQKSGPAPTSGPSNTDYGILLERIISY